MARDQFNRHLINIRLDELFQFCLRWPADSGDCTVIVDCAHMLCSSQSVRDCAVPFSSTPIHIICFVHFYVRKLIACVFFFFVGFSRVIDITREHHGHLKWSDHINNNTLLFHLLFSSVFCCCFHFLLFHFSKKSYFGCKNNIKQQRLLLINIFQYAMKRRRKLTKK